MERLARDGFGRDELAQIDHAAPAGLWALASKIFQHRFDFAGHLRIMVQEMLPNALPPVIVTTSVLVASAILIESALSFLGMGDPNAVSWGSMIGEGRELLRTAWYLTALPGAAIVLTVLALNLLGDGLNDAFNPRLRGR